MEAQTQKVGRPARPGFTAFRAPPGLPLPNGAQKQLAFFLLVGVVLLLWWGLAMPRPILDPFAERGW